MAESFERMIWQALPFQVPRAIPTTSVELGVSVVSVAVTMPDAAVVNAKLAAPLLVSVPENVSVTVVGVVVVGVVGELLPHAAVLTANATARTLSRLIVLLRKPLPIIDRTLNPF